MASTTSITGHLECGPDAEASLEHLAIMVDRFVGRYPRPGGYNAATSMAAILNSGNHDQIKAAFGLLRRWEFEPSEV